MIIPSEVTRKWNSLIDHGDIGEIAEKSGYSKPTISKALDSGEATMEVFEAIQNFFNIKQNKIDSLTGK